jgi:hypothetical protein
MAFFKKKKANGAPKKVSARKAKKMKAKWQAYYDAGCDGECETCEYYDYCPDDFVEDEVEEEDAEAIAQAKAEAEAQAEEEELDRIEAGAQKFGEGVRGAGDAIVAKAPDVAKSAGAMAGKVVKGARGVGGAITNAASGLADAVGGPDDKDKAAADGAQVDSAAKDAVATTAEGDGAAVAEDEEIELTEEEQRLFDEAAAYYADGCDGECETCEYYDYCPAEEEEDPDNEVVFGSVTQGQLKEGAKEGVALAKETAAAAKELKEAMDDIKAVTDIKSWLK